MSKFNNLKLLFILLPFARIIVVFSPQPGYIQPDEFHQFTEPLAEKFLNVKTLKCWEFEREQPIRSMVIPQLLISPLFIAFNQIYSATHYFQLSGYWVLVLPRFIMVLFSFIIDLVLYRLVKIINDDRSSKNNQPLLISLIHSSSYLAFTYYNRTFTNTIETILLSLLLLVIFESINGKTLFTSSKIGFLLAAGFFNRPTFAVFAMIPTLFWIFSHKRNHQKQWIVRGLCNSLLIFPSFLLTLIVFIVGDTIFYERLNMMDLHLFLRNPSLFWENFVITPLNFIEYNIRPKNLENHGLHPWYFHTMVSLPLMFTLLAPIIYWSVLKNFGKLLKISNYVEIYGDFSKIKGEKCFRYVLAMTIFVSLAILSLIPHHEPRFLLPLIVPILCLYGNHLINIMKKFRSLLYVWLFTQLTLTMFYGWAHQAGITRSLLYLQNEYNHYFIDDHVNTTLLFSRMYLPPRHLLLIPNNRKNIEIIDHSIESIDKSLETMTLWSSSKYDQSLKLLFIIIPSCYDEIIKLKFTNMNVKMKLIHKNFPNFNAEDLDHCLWSSSSPLNDENNLTAINKLTDKIWQTFSMSIWLIE